MAHTIKVTIDKTGNTTFEVEGVKGANCEEITKSFEEAMGKVTARKQTAEYHESQPTNVQKNRAY